MKKMKNNLDERQEQTLLKIERNSFWIVFWGLVIAIAAQAVIFRADPRSIIGESVLLLTVSAYMGISCLRNGIWDRRLKADPKTNFIVALIAGLAAGAVTFIRVYSDFPDKIYGSAAAGVFTLFFTFALCFALLSLSARAYKKRLEKLEADSDSSDE